MRETGNVQNLEIIDDKKVIVLKIESDLFILFRIGFINILFKLLSDGKLLIAL